jgi:hypothetical protein
MNTKYVVLYLKNKRAMGVAQVVKCLPSKHEALNSIPNTTKNKQGNMQTLQFWQ